MKETLRKRATRAVDAIHNLDNLFKNDVKQNAIAIIMLAIEDAYRQGKADGMTAPVGEEHCNSCQKEKS